MTIGCVTNVFIRKALIGAVISTPTLLLKKHTGVVGDVNYGAISPRHVLIASQEVLECHGSYPGDLLENITIRGIDLHELAPGNLLKLGKAVIKVTYPNEQCKTVCKQIKEDRGQMGVVVHSGHVSPGDKVVVLSKQQEIIPQNRYELFLHVTKQIPMGKVLTYKDLILAIGGTSSHFRILPKFIRQASKVKDCPTHRIVTSLGKITGYTPNQKHSLFSENVQVVDDIVDTIVYTWSPSKSTLV